ncbi:capsid portal protein, partial [Salmonella enterica]|nr:capsid portal protein [Salmonella enterica]
LVFVRNELIPLQKRLAELNEWIGETVISFNEYKLN